MLLGKRPRPPMNRTTSMKEFTLDLSNTTIDAAAEGGVAYSQPFDPSNPFLNVPHKPSADGGLDQSFMVAASSVLSRTGRRHSADFLETPPFLKACSLCKRSLIPGRDIYMYRGDSAFCSLECRQQQMNQDERKEKCSLASKMEVVVNTVTGSEVPTTAETVAAV